MSDLAPRRGRPLWWWLLAVGLLQLALLVAAMVAIAWWYAPRDTPSEYRPGGVGSAAGEAAAVEAGDPLGIVAPLRKYGNDRGRLADALRSLRDRYGIAATIYDDTGKPVLSNTKTPVPFREPRPFDHLRRGVPVPPPVRPLPSLPPPAPAPPHEVHGHDSIHDAPPGAALGPSASSQPGPPSGRLGPPPGGRPPGLVHGVGFVLDGKPATIVIRLERPDTRTAVLIAILVVGLAIIAIGVVVTSRWIVTPLRQVTSTAARLAEGDLAARSNLQRGDEIGELGRTVDDMAAYIQTLVASEKEMLANVAHELRTPLARVRVAAEIAADGNADVAAASLQGMTQDLVELEDIIDDVLTTTKLMSSHSTELVVRKTQVNPAHIAQAAAERFRSLYPRPLVLACPADVPHIEADPKLLRRAIDNLLGNAHKYSSNTAAAVELELRVVDDTKALDPAVQPRSFGRTSATLTAIGRSVQFLIRDQGVGIPSADLPRIFEPFYRGEKSRDRQAGGVGIGLTLAKRIVDAHGGTLELSSVVNTGTTVTLALPARARNNL